MAIDVLICNLTRLGDLLQTQALIDDLHQSGKSVGLLCLENFASALPMIRNISASWQLPGARLMSLMDSDWPAAIASLLDFTSRIAREGSPGHVLNLTPSLPARIISSLIARSGARSWGFGLDNYGFGVDHGVWTTFLAVSAQKRVNAPFNVADIFRMTGAGLGANLQGSTRLAKPQAAALAWADSFTHAAMPSATPQGYVCFQPGASEERRRWPLEHFLELGKTLWERAQLIPVLLGSANEAGLGRQYALKASHPFINAIGKTDLGQLGALLLKSRLLVTNDTGTMHLASGLGVPSLAFFLATAQPWDTGPMLADCCCLEPAMSCHPCAFGASCQNGNACLRQISAASAAKLALAWLGDKDWSKGVDTEVRRECRVWRTKHDERGLAAVECLSGHENEPRSAWLAWLREFWRQLLDSLEIGMSQETGASAETDVCLFAQNRKPPLPPHAAKTAELLANAANILDSISACAEVAGKSPRGGELLLRNCDRLRIMLDNYEPLASLAAFWNEFRLGQGDDLDKFTRGLPILKKHFLAFGNSLAQVAPT